MLDAVSHLKLKQQPIQDCADHSASLQNLAMMDRSNPQHLDYPQSSWPDAKSLDLSHAEDHLIFWVLVACLELEDLKTQALAHDTMEAQTKVSRLLRDEIERAMVEVPG